MAKNYIPTLRKLVYVLCRYITRYHATLRPAHEAADLAAYDALKLACEAYLIANPEPPPTQ